MDHTETIGLRKIPRSHTPGRVSVFINRAVRAAQVGQMLFAAAALGLISGGWALAMGFQAINRGMALLPLAGVALVTLWSATLVLVSLLDARSRYQDYKRAKDIFYENGCQTRAARLFIHSRCQRDAALRAARDLGMESWLAGYYRGQGYRWYHILPDTVHKRPGLLLTWRFWARTLFAPAYTSSYFLW